MVQDQRTDTSELVEIVRQDARGKLLDLLDNVPGKKQLVFDNSLLGPLDFFVSKPDLEDHGVHKFWKLEGEVIQETAPAPTLIFLIRCVHVDLVDKIANQILADEAAQRDRTYTVIFVPRITQQCEQRLKDRNVHANVSVEEFPLYFFPFDGDVLSMEQPGVFNEFHVKGDPASAFYTAQALVALQRHFGVIPQVYSIGPAGKSVVDCMQRAKKEDTMNDPLKDPQLSRSQQGGQPGVPPVAPHAAKSDQGNSGKPSIISEIVIIDRKVDIYSVLCSQFTYEAMIDASLGLKNHQVDISRFPWAKERETILRMSPDDPFYKEIRHLHIDQIGSLLGKRAVAIEETYKKKETIKDASEIKEYLPEFKKAQQEHPRLEKNINLAQHLKNDIQSVEAIGKLKLEDDITSGNSQEKQTPLETIEDLITDQKPLDEVLRLLCLYSLVNNGVKPKYLDPLKGYIRQSYGIEHLLTLTNAEHAGILRYQAQKSSWSSIKRVFNLFVEGPEAQQDISYAYSGYAPLSVRLVQMTRSLKQGWRSLASELGMLPGPAQELPQPLPQGQIPPNADEPSVVVVCFIGGVTYGEIAALRRLSELEDNRRKFLIVTTEFLNAKKFFESLRCEQIFNESRVEVDRAKAAPSQASRGFGFWPGGR